MNTFGVKRPVTDSSTLSMSKTKTTKHVPPPARLVNSFADPTSLAQTDTSRDVLPRGGTSQAPSVGVAWYLREMGASSSLLLIT
ncbi:hypothetical protein TNCV_5051641 [Trichonephila clavipes]|nr:hypothetical protein TNCV_5051641 [Trichonephila clavipes]